MEVAVVRQRVKMNIVWTTAVAGLAVFAAGASAQWRGPYPPANAIGRYDAALRLDVKPKQTEVYVDGYYSGVVDDFDGLWERLRLASGEHEITLYLDGHRPYLEKLAFRPGQTLRLRHTMEPLPPGEVAQRPKPSEAARAAQPPERRPPTRRAGRGASNFGSLVISLQPADAEIFIDGERWTLAPGERQLVVEVSAGPHRIEIRKEGYQTFTTTIQMRRGESVPLNVNLTRQSIEIAGFALSPSPSPRWDERIPGRL